MIISSWHLHGFIIFCVIFFAPILTGVYKNGALTWFWHCQRIWAILVPVLTLVFFHLDFGLRHQGKSGVLVVVALVAGWDLCQGWWCKEGSGGPLLQINTFPYFFDRF